MIIFFISVTSHALDPSPCHKLSHLLGPLPLECDVLYGRPLPSLLATNPLTGLSPPHRFKTYMYPHRPPLLLVLLLFVLLFVFLLYLLVCHQFFDLLTDAAGIVILLKTEFLCQSVRPPVCLSTRLSVHPSVRPSVCPSTPLSVHPSVRPSVCPSIRLSVHPSLYLPVCAFFEVNQPFSRLIPLEKRRLEQYDYNRCPSLSVCLYVCVALRLCLTMTSFPLSFSLHLSYLISFFSISK